MTRHRDPFYSRIVLFGASALLIAGLIQQEHMLTLGASILFMLLVVQQLVGAVLGLGETIKESAHSLSDRLSAVQPVAENVVKVSKVEPVTQDDLRQQLAADQKLKSLGQLAAGVAHELNTPIQYVSNNVAFIRDELLNVCGLLSEYKELTSHIPECVDGTSRINQLYRESDPEYLINEIPSTLSQTIDGLSHITQIVGALREFSHPGSKEALPTDINRVINTVVALCRNEWKYVADLILDLDTSLPTVECHQSDISQVLLNMIVNSAHAIEEKTKGVGKGSIHITTSWSGDEVEISIRDSGAGIPESVLSRIFDPFFTTKPQGKGTGQGLSISRHLIEEVHGGTLAVMTEVDKGTEFLIRLPRKWHAASLAGRTTVV